MRLTTLWALARSAASIGGELLARAPHTTRARKDRLDALYQGFRPAFAGVEDVTPEMLRTALDTASPPLVVDVRAERERSVSTLPGAITASDFLAEPGQAAGRLVVAFCTLGVRSGAWCRERNDEGVVVANLAGGLLAWTHAGGELVAADGAPTRRVHVSGSHWDLVPKCYEGVW